MLTAASFLDGALTIESEVGESDVVQVSSPTDDILRIEVGNGDTFNLGEGITGDPNFSLNTDGNILDINVGESGISLASAEFKLGDQDDNITFDSGNGVIEFRVYGGDGDDSADASQISNLVTLIGGNGDDVLYGGSNNDTIYGGNGNDEINGFGGDDYLVGDGQIEVSITNLQLENGAILTPAFFATTDGVYDFFNEGSAASANLERLAEDGITAERIAAALNSGGVSEAVSTSDGIILPGESRSVEFLADSQEPLAQYLSFASMVIPSNDAFIGNDDPQLLDLFDGNGNLIQRTGAGAFIVSGSQVWDAGTEVNDEIVENTAGLGQMAPNTGESENGTISQHPGFLGSNSLGGELGNILTARPNADFTIPGSNIASIEIRSDEGNDIIYGGAGNDQILGGGGDDILVGGDNADEIHGGAGNDILEGGGQIEITITNLQEEDGGLLTPVFFATTNGIYDFFDVGSAASESLERLAEDGNVGPRIDAALASGGVFEALATDGGPIGPGESRSLTLTATNSNELTQYLSFASMFIPSNDAFIGNDDPTQIDLFDSMGDLIQRFGGSAIIISGDEVYDAGTEANDEIPENTAALNQSAPNTGETEGGVIRQHEGFQGSVRLGGVTGNILTARPNADFTAPGSNVLQIEVWSNDGDDILIGGDGDDMIDGSLGIDTTENHFAESAARVIVSGTEESIQINDISRSRDELQNVEIVDLNSGNENDRYVVRSIAAAGVNQLNINAGNGRNVINAGKADTALNIVTGDGNDIVRGGSQDDAILTNGGSDFVFGNGGDDEIDAGNGRNRVFGNNGNDSITTGDGHDEIFGGNGDDAIDAGNGRNRIQGGSGDDQIISGDGIDSVLAGAGDDYVNSGRGNDNVVGGSGNDILLGEAGRDLIRGGAGRDLIFGGIGLDNVFAGRDDDIITSGSTSLMEAELMLVRDIWTADDSYDDRLAQLTDPDNGLGVVLDSTTLTSDGDRNLIFGQGQRDLFFASLVDNLFRANDEELILI